MSDAEDTKPYEVEIAVAAGRDQVWDAVTQPPVIAQWFGWDYDGLTAEIEQIFVTEATFLAPERMGWSDDSYLEVTGDDDSSRVRAVRGEPPAGDPERFDAIEEGWRAFLIQLRYLLEESPKGGRRTLYLTGDSTGAQALGLSTGEWSRFGSHTAWVVEDGHLVVVSGHEPLDDAAAGRIEIIVSTFGVDDHDFTELREAWSKRWAPLAREATVTVGEGS